MYCDSIATTATIATIAIKSNLLKERQNLWPNLVEVVGRNIRKGFKDIAIFEIGKAFNVGPDGNPVEDYRVSIALMNGTDNPLAELYQKTPALL